MSFLTIIWRCFISLYMRGVHDTSEPRGSKIISLALSVATLLHLFHPIACLFSCHSYYSRYTLIIQFSPLSSFLSFINFHLFYSSPPGSIHMIKLPFYYFGLIGIYVFPQSRPPVFIQQSRNLESIEKWISIDCRKWLNDLQIGIKLLFHATSA